MKKQKRAGGSPVMRTKKEDERSILARVSMDINKDKINPNKRYVCFNNVVHKKKQHKRNGKTVCVSS